MATEGGTSSKAKTRRVVLAVGLFFMIVLTLVRGMDPGPVRDVRSNYFDYLQIYSPRAYEPLPVRVVDIDEPSLSELGQWPWPRELLAELVDQLSAYGAAVIVFDAIFAEPDRMSPSSLVSRLSKLELPTTAVDLDILARLDTDVIFANSLANSVSVLGLAETAGEESAPPSGYAGFVEIGDQPGLYAARLYSPSNIVGALHQAATGIGVISVTPGNESRVIRKVPMFWQTENGYYPSLSLEALRLAFGESTIRLQGANEVPGFMNSIGIGDMAIPTLPNGEVWVRYRRDHPDLYVSARHVLDKEFSPEMAAALEGNIVLIGTSAAGLLDIRNTALRESVPGVSIHAQVLEQILLGDHLTRNDIIEGLEIIAFVILGVIVLGVMAWAGPVVSLLVGGAAGAVVLGGSWLSFINYGILFDATYPIIGGFLAFTGLAGYQYIVADRDKRLIRNSFSHYVAPSILDQIESSGQMLGLGGENRTVTVMFCDIRNFTPLSETMPATDLVALLNELFTDLGTHILDENGTIDKFIGDAIMAFWNAPLQSEFHREESARAALKMRKALDRFNQDADRVPIATAIGISTGVACVGNIGSKDRFNYSAVGDTVNVAARVEAACRHVNYDILVTTPTADGIEQMATLDAGSLDLKGKSTRTQTFVLVGDETVAESPEFKELQALHHKVVASLSEHGTVAGELIEECIKTAVKIEPGLETFFRRIHERAEDYNSLQE